MNKKGRGESKEHLTSEYLSKKFNNRFDMVNHAIKLAEDMIISGRGPRVRVDAANVNTANVVLEEIAQDKDYFENVIGEEEEEEDGTTVVMIRSSTK